MARIRSKSLKSEGLIGLDNEVIWIPRLLEAAFILESASLPLKISSQIHKYVQSSISNYLG